MNISGAIPNRSTRELEIAVTELESAVGENSRASAGRSKGRNERSKKVVKKKAAFQEMNHAPNA
jgi:hypothetical protein